tara:strand:+ start:6288 stop:6701 length:414 start_codon:yes stop_codon:yes gene_type:complete
MLLISHRGNILGPCPEENNPELVLDTLRKFEVEVDAWYYKNMWYLGHDEPQYLIKSTFFSKKMWIHCKNFEAMAKLEGSGLNYFWHETDKCTLTSQGFIWCYPGFHVDGAIVVPKEKGEQFKDSILGICTDYPMDYL